MAFTFEPPRPITREMAHVGTVTRFVRDEEDALPQQGGGEGEVSDIGGGGGGGRHCHGREGRGDQSGLILNFMSYGEMLFCDAFAQFENQYFWSAVSHNHKKHYIKQ